MRALLSVCLVAVFAATSFAADAEWGEPVNGLSIRVAIVPAEAGPAVQFSVRNAGTRDLSVQLGWFYNGRRDPYYLELVSRGSDGLLRAIPYSAILGISASSESFKPWIVTIHPKETFTFQEPTSSFFALSLAQGDLWVELRVSDPVNGGCDAHRWIGSAFSNILKLPQ